MKSEEKEGVMNDENLRTLSPSEAREYGRRGGVRSGEVRRERKKLREYLEVALDKGTDFEGEAMSNAEAITVALINKAKGGDVRAYQTIRDGLGEKPAEHIVSEPSISPERYAEVEALLFGGIDDE
jgi:hypothetical protein